MWVAGVPVVVGALGTVTKGFEKRLKKLDIRRRNDAIQTSVLLWSGKIVTRVEENWRDLLSFMLQWKITNLIWCEKPARSRIMPYALIMPKRKLKMRMKIACINCVDGDESVNHINEWGTLEQ